MSKVMGANRKYLPKWDVSTKKMGGSPHKNPCFSAQKIHEEENLNASYAVTKAMQEGIKHTQSTH